MASLREPHRILNVDCSTGVETESDVEVVREDITSGRPKYGISSEERGQHVWDRKEERKDNTEDRELTVMDPQDKESRSRPRNRVTVEKMSNPGQLQSPAGQDRLAIGGESRQQSYTDEGESSGLNGMSSTSHIFVRRQKMRRRVRLPAFTGKESWKVGINRFEDIAGHIGWDEEDKLDVDKNAGRCWKICLQLQLCVD